MAFLTRTILLQNWNSNKQNLLQKCKIICNQKANISISKMVLQNDTLDTKFNDAKSAFKSKTNAELIRAYLVYTICSFEVIVTHNLAIMKATRAVVGERIFNLIMKATFYGHFVAGEDEVKIVPVLERLRSFGVNPILDYSVEEDISQEEAVEREVEASVPELGENVEKDLKQFHVDRRFADRRLKVQSARTYFYLNEATCEKNMDIFIRCIEAVAKNNLPGGSTGYTAIKLTALGRPQLLLQLSEVIMRARRYMNEIFGGKGNVLTHHTTIEDLEAKLVKITDQESVKKFLTQVTADKNGILHLFPWSGIIDENRELSASFRVPDLKSGRMERFITQLTPREEEMFRNMIRRINNVTIAAQELNVRIMVDAEQTYFQPAITRITLEFMRKFNAEKPVVFNTYQCYLKNALEEVSTDLEQAHRQNFYFGAKLVRGAYLEQERARATTMDYPDPTNPNFEATSEMYHTTLTECLRRIKVSKDKNEDQKKITIVVASHNEDTVRFAIEKMKELNISPGDRVICFGQLLGMCDHITFPLGQAGYSAYKYIPYGPVAEVLPYLSRRAHENKGMLKKIKKEKKLLIGEIIRRVVTGQWWYTPQGNYTPV